jgi:hypothetical protein
MRKIVHGITIFFFSFIIISILSNYIYAEATKPICIIDIPTADVTDYSSYDLNFRLYGTGGILSKMVFGVFKPINIGVSWDTDKVIGSQSVDVRPPAIHFKARIYAGGLYIPQMAIGYDGQGYGSYDKNTDKYFYREKGIYLAMTREIFVPGLELTFGANIYDFDKQGIFEFIGFTYNLEDKIMLLSEYDNIHKTPENRANVGLRLNISESIAIDLAGRNIFKKDLAERVLVIKYKGNF